MKRVLQTVAVAGAVVVALAGCASETTAAIEGAESTPSDTAEVEPSDAAATEATEATESAEESEPSAEAAGLPAECSGYIMSQDTDGDPIAEAVAGMAWSEAVGLMGTQVLASTDEEGMYDAVVRTCSDELTEDELFGLGTQIGAAIEASDAGDTLATLRVTSWAPDGSGSIAEAAKIRCEDFQMYLWDGALSDSSNWELAGRDY